MKQRLIGVRFLALAAGLLLVGCHVPDADVTTTQDPKYPLDRQSKIGFPAEADVPDVNARLANEFGRQQLLAMGYAVVPATDADYLLSLKEAPRDLTVAESDGSPSLGTAVGDGSGGLFTGVGVGIPLGPPEAVTIHRTELDAVLQTVENPKITVWQGKILAETTDEAEYRTPFYRALLSRIGTTFNGTIRLDRTKEVQPSP